MKHKTDNPMKHVGKLLLIVVAFPFALVGVLAWGAVVLGRAAAKEVGRKKPVV